MSRINDYEDYLASQESNSHSSEGLARQLRNRIGLDVVIYERNGNRAFGTIREVRNNVLILGNTPGNPNTPAKQICTCNNQTQTETFAEVIISIREITEFTVR